MKCPYCHKEAQVRDAVKRNLETYGGSGRARAAWAAAETGLPSVTRKAQERRLYAILSENTFYDTAIGG